MICGEKSLLKMAANVFVLENADVGVWCVFVLPKM